MTGPASAPAVSPAALRDVLGHFATGVVVVTAREPDGTLLGFTCQSFASLSLDPPLVSFAPARTSSTWPRIRDVGTFCVNVLAADHRDLSAGFARSGAASTSSRASTGARPRRARRCSRASAPGSTARCGRSTTAATTRSSSGTCTTWARIPPRLPLLFYRGAYGINGR